MFIHHDSPKECIHIFCYSFDVGTLGNVLKRCFCLNTQLRVVFSKEPICAWFSHIQASISPLSFTALVFDTRCFPPPCPVLVSDKEVVAASNTYNTNHLAHLTVKKAFAE